ncbi:MAG: REP-associated tyrosine transposase [Bacteroidales bacterium]
MSKTASNPDQLYFVTFTIVEWGNLFTCPEYFRLLEENLQFCQDNKGLEIFEFVIMTNHLHLICRRNGVPLSHILRDFKSFTSKELIKLISNNPSESRKKWMLNIFKKHGRSNILNQNYQVWQNFNSPTLLNYKSITAQKVNYIRLNPVKAGIVSRPEDYVHCSANPDSPLKLSPLDFF